MHAIYFTDWTDEEEIAFLKKLLVLLPESLQSRAKRYKFHAPAINFVLGRLLLIEGLEKVGLGPEAISKVYFSKNGKPLHPNISFNISHSGKLVACAISSVAEIGIDVEHQRQIDFDLFTNWFLAEEWRSIKSAEDPQKQFFWYWRRKESILKAMDKNLDYLAEVNLQDGSSDLFVKHSKTWYLEELDLGKGRKLASCSEVQDQMEIREIKF